MQRALAWDKNLQSTGRPLVVEWRLPAGRLRAEPCYGCASRL